MESKALDVAQERTFLIASVVVLICAFAMRLNPSPLHEATLFGLPLPDVCPFHRITGFWCPGCGLTRSFVAMAHGQVRWAFDLNPLGPILFGATLFQIPYRTFKLLGRALNPPTFAKRCAEPVVYILGSWMMLLGAYRIGWAFTHVALARTGVEPPTTWPSSIAITLVSIGVYAIGREVKPFYLRRATRPRSA